MQDLIHVEATPALLRVNFAELKDHLERELKRYNVVVTADTVRDAKTLATELNKTASVIDQRRKDEVARVSEPVRRFDAQMKELVKLCKDGRQQIVDQVQRFEDETRERARSLLETTRENLWEQHEVAAEHRRAEIDDLVKLTALTAKGRLAAAPAAAVESRVQADKSRQQLVAMRLVELENRSHRAGLSAPLTRDHVHQWVEADEATYERELDRILAAEVEREKLAQERMQARMDREAREREARERESSQQASQREEANHRSIDEASYADLRASGGLAEAQEVTQARPTSGKVAWRATCTFETQAPNRATAEQIEAELAAALKRAGFKTLVSVRADRVHDAA